MSWSGCIVDDKGNEVLLAGEEKAAWKAVRDAHKAKFGSVPSGLENGYIHLSDTYVTALEMGYSIANMELDADDVENMAVNFERERPGLLERDKEREFYADYLVNFFKTAAQFRRGIQGGH